MHKFQLHVCHGRGLLYQEITIQPSSMSKSSNSISNSTNIHQFKYELKRDFPPHYETQTLLPFYLFSVN